MGRILTMPQQEIGARSACCCPTLLGCLCLFIYFFLNLINGSGSIICHGFSTVAKQFVVFEKNWRTHYYVRSTESIKENDVSTKTLHELVDLAMPWETFSHHGCSNWSVGLQLRSSCMYHDQSCVISHLLSKIP